MSVFILLLLSGLGAFWGPRDPLPARVISGSSCLPALTITGCLVYVHMAWEERAASVPHLLREVGGAKKTEDSGELKGAPSHCGQGEIWAQTGQGT